MGGINYYKVIRSCVICYCDSPELRLRFLSSELRLGHFCFQDTREVFRSMLEKLSAINNSDNVSIGRCLDAVYDVSLHVLSYNSIGIAFCSIV